MNKFISTLILSGALVGFVSIGTSVTASAESQLEKEVDIQELSNNAIAQISELGYDLSDPELIIYDLTDPKKS